MNQQLTNELERVMLSASAGVFAPVLEALAVTARSLRHESSGRLADLIEDAARFAERHRL